MKRKKAILVVSFGTSYKDTREKTIDVIERQIAEEFPDYAIYRAWTSKMIINKIKRRDDIHIHTVTQAMEQMKHDGISDIIIQPTHILNGVENDIMKQDALVYHNDFQSIVFGDPLLTTTEDIKQVLHAIADRYKDLTEECALVLMGHGTTHYVNPVYAAMDYMFKDEGHHNIFVGTVEAYPEIDTLLRKVRLYNPKKILLAPLMIVAGDHARNDMASDEEDSWKTLFSNEGYEVRCCLDGLGEYPGIRDIFVAHINNTLL